MTEDDDLGGARIYSSYAALYIFYPKLLTKIGWQVWGKNDSARIVIGTSKVLLVLCGSVHTGVHCFCTKKAKEGLMYFLIGFFVFGGIAAGVCGYWKHSKPSSPYNQNWRDKLWEQHHPTKDSLGR